MSLAKDDIRGVESDRAPVRMLAYAFLAASLLLNTRLPAELVLLYAIACVVPAVTSYVRSVRQRNGDEDPQWMKGKTSSKPERRECKQRLTRNPFDSDDPNRLVEDRITDAAELCVQYGRRAIVILLTLDDVSSEHLSAVAAVAQQTVRRTDLVEIVSANEIVIGLAMIHDFVPASSVSERLRKALAASSNLGDVRISAGAAIYPLHGYTGAELIAAARRNLRAWVTLLPA